MYAEAPGYEFGAAEIEHKARKQYPNSQVQLVTIEMLPKHATFISIWSRLPCHVGRQVRYRQGAEGRTTTVARASGISTQAITDWFAGWSQPTAGQILDVQIPAETESVLKSTL
jgi:hypothetical protein